MPCLMHNGVVNGQCVMDTTQGHTCTLRPIAIAPPAVCLCLSVVCALCSMFNFYNYYNVTLTVHVTLR